MYCNNYAGKQINHTVILYCNNHMQEQETVKFTPFWFFLVFDFCRFCLVIRFFHPRHTANDLRLWRIDFEGFSIADFIHCIYFPILILEKEPVFPFWMFSAKQGHYWYHFYNVFGMTIRPLDWGLNAGPPALDASTIPLGYRGGGCNS